MGDLDFKSKQEKEHLKRITSALKRRGLIPELDGDAWQVHGPHQDMNYQWYEGWAYYKDDPEDSVYVNIYPKRVYAIDPSGSPYGQYTVENEIPVIK